MIKVGQIYKHNNSLLVVTFVNKSFVSREQVQLIKNDGFTFGWSHAKAQKYLVDLITEYPTWQEAVNSLEFKGEK